MNIVVDALDHFAPRYAINEACVRNKIPYIYGGALASYGNVSTIIPGQTACLECITGKLEDSLFQTCETVGVYPPVLSIIASIQVREALSILLGKQPKLANKLFFADMHTLEFESFNLVRRPDCGTCGVPLVEAKSMASDLKVIELCGKSSYMVSPKTPLVLDLDRAFENIRKVIKMKIRAAFGLTFDYSEQMSVSLMKTGNMLIKGAGSEKEVILVYDEVMRVVSC